MRTWGLRARELVSRYLGAVVALLVVFVLVGGAVTYTTHVERPTTTEQRVVATWQPSGDFSHAATVERSNEVYERGTTLGNRSVYFSRITPVLDGQYAFEYRATDSGSLDATVRLGLVTRSVEEDGDARSVLWETTEPLVDPRNATLDAGDRLRVPFSVDVERARNRSQRITESLGGSVGTTETFVRATVVLNGTTNGGQVNERMVHTLPLAIADGTYRVNEGDNAMEPRETTRPVTVPRTYGPIRGFGGPLLLLLGLLGLGAVVRVRSTDRLELNDAERAWLSYRDDRSAFDEWITSVRLPAEAFDRPRATADSLEDLVDFAIDTNNAVIESTDDHNYYVVHGKFLYVYVPPEVPADAWGADGSEDEGEGVKTIHEPVPESDEESHSDVVGTSSDTEAEESPPEADDDVTWENESDDES